MDPIDNQCIRKESYTDNMREIVYEAREDTPYGNYVGNCKWFNSKLGYGFIRVCSGELRGVDIFVHHSGLKPLNSSFKTMFKGEYVHFNISEGRNGKQAIDVTGIYGGPLMCDNISTTYMLPRCCQNMPRSRSGSIWSAATGAP